MSDTIDYVEFDPAIHLTLEQAAKRRGVKPHTLLCWINDGLYLGLKARPAHRYAATKRFRWIIPRETVDMEIPKSLAPPSIMAENAAGELVEWITLAEATRRQGCSKFKLQTILKTGAIPTIEKRINTKNDKTKTYLLASATTHITPHRMVPPKRTSAKTSAPTGALRAHTPERPRPVRTAEGWRIEQHKRRSRTEYASYAEAEKAIKRGRWV